MEGIDIQPLTNKVESVSPLDNSLALDLKTRLNPRTAGNKPTEEIIKEWLGENRITNLDDANRIARRLSPAIEAVIKKVAGGHLGNHEKVAQEMIDRVANFISVSVEENADTIGDIIENRMQKNEGFWHAERLKQLRNILLTRITNTGRRDIVDTIMKKKILEASKRGEIPN